MSPALRASTMQAPWVGYGPSSIASTRRPPRFGPLRLTFASEASWPNDLGSVFVASDASMFYGAYDASEACEDVHAYAASRRRL